MKVLIATGLFPPEGGGPATYSKTLLDELPKRGIEVSVLPYREVRNYPKFMRHAAYFFMLLSRTLREKPDIIYAQDPFSVGFPAALVSFFMRKKFLLKVVGDYAWEQGTDRFKYRGTVEQFQKDDDLFIIPLIMRALERWVARRAVRIIVPSKYLSGIVRQWGVPKKKRVVVYNGIEVRQVGSRQVIRGMLKFHGKLVISVSRLVPWKGFEALIRVHARLVKTVPDLKLLIVGSGPEAPALERLAETCGVADSVIFAGNVERAVVLRYMRASDVFVLNTRYEGFSHLLLEASAVGVPIITTPAGGNTEIIDDGVNGYLVKPDDEAALEKRIRELLTSPEARARLAAGAQKRITDFSISRMVDETVNVLRRV